MTQTERMSLPLAKINQCLIISLEKRRSLLNKFQNKFLNLFRQLLLIRQTIRPKTLIIHRKSRCLTICLDWVKKRQLNHLFNLKHQKLEQDLLTLIIKKSEKRLTKLLIKCTRINNSNKNQSKQWQMGQA